MNHNKAHTALVRQLLQYLKLRGILAWQVDSGAVYDPVRKRHRKAKHKRKGVADICGVLPGGRALACEAKTGTGRLDKDQRQFRDDVQKAGGLWVLCRSLDDLQAALEAKESEQC